MCSATLTQVEWIWLSTSPETNSQREEQDYLRNVASIQQYILGAPFHKYFKALQEEKLAGLPTKILHFSPNESMFFSHVLHHN